MVIYFLLLTVLCILSEFNVIDQHKVACSIVYPNIIVNIKIKVDIFFFVFTKQNVKSAA